MGRQQLSFEALQRCAAAGGRTAVRLAEELPAHFVVFDVLQARGEVLLKQPYAARRARLEELFTEYALTPPWLLCRATDDVRTAQEWLTPWTQQPGVGGLVIKGQAQHCPPGVRGWYKGRGQEEGNAEHGLVRARVEHTFAGMKNWKILRDCRQRGDGLHHAVQTVATMHNLALAE